ncbi:hypothetical protein evm_012719 [Chilo suppressalis]|nr:hypothetical protein evm_012719 [Chilo suppressalis]
MEDFWKHIQVKVKNVKLLSVSEQDIEERRIPSSVPGFRGTMSVHQVLWSCDRHQITFRKLSSFLCENGKICRHKYHLGFMNLPSNYENFDAEYLKHFINENTTHEILQEITNPPTFNNEVLYKSTTEALQNMKTTSNSAKNKKITILSDVKLHWTNTSFIGNKMKRTENNNFQLDFQNFVSSNLLANPRGARWRKWLPRSAAIVEVNQLSQVTKKLLSRAPPCLGRHVKPLVPNASAVLSNPHWPSVVDHGPLNSLPRTLNKDNHSLCYQILDTLSAVLNLDITGNTRTVDKWKKVWSDLKINQKKAAKIQRSAVGTGGGPACKLVLTDLEQRVLNIIGSQAATGLMVDEVGDFELVAPSQQVAPPQPKTPPLLIEPATEDSRPDTSGQSTPFAAVEEQVEDAISPTTQHAHVGVPSHRQLTPRRRRVRPG